MRLVIGILFCASLWGAAHDITACRIVGDATTVTDAASAANVSTAPAGWVLECDMTVDADMTGKPISYALGIGANNSVSAAKIRLTVTSHDPLGGTFTRPVYGTHQLRQVYQVGVCANGSAPCPNDQIIVGTTATFRVALGSATTRPGDGPPNGYVYAGDTATVDIDAGTVTYSGTGNPAVTGMGVTNNSTLAAPQAIAYWTRPWLTRITESTFRVCATGIGAGSHDGMPLRQMTFVATDGVHSQTLSSTMPILSRWAGANDPTQEYCVDFTSSTFDQASIVTVNFQAVPWIGTSAAILDSSAAPCLTQPTHACAPITYLMDRLGTFGTAVAVVDPAAADDTPSCAAAAGTDPSTISPCKTIRGAAIKMSAFNLANYSRRDLAGTMYLKAGNYTWTGSTDAITADSGTNASTTWLRVTRYPGLTVDDVVINAATDTTYNKLTATPIMIDGITVNDASATSSTFQANGTGRYLWTKDSKLHKNAGSSLHYYFGLTFWTGNSQIISADCQTGSTISSDCAKGAYIQYSSTSWPAIVRGNSFNGVAHVITACTLLGNTYDDTNTNATIKISPQESGGTLCTQPIIAFNRFQNQKNTGSIVSVGGTLSFGATTTTLWGTMFALNLVEYNSTSVSGITVATASDASTNTPVENMHWLDSTLVGMRANMGYNDNGTTLRLRTNWFASGMVWDALASKHDTFSPANGVRVGAWSWLYGVGLHGNANLEAPSFCTTCDYQLEFAGVRSYQKPIAASQDAQATTQPPTAAGNAIGWAGFVDRQSWDGTAIGTGNGDYRLKSNSPLIGLRPPGGCNFPYDLWGKPCNNSGYGTPGVDEAASRMTPVFW